MVKCQFLFWRIKSKPTRELTLLEERKSSTIYSPNSNYISCIIPKKQIKKTYIFEYFSHLVKNYQDNVLDPNCSMVFNLLNAIL